MMTEHILENEQYKRVLRFDAVESAVSSSQSRQVLFDDLSFREDLFGLLDSLLLPEMILSLDVFDTLLLRDNSSELTRFIEIGGRMAAHIGGVAPMDGFMARHLGTKATYRASKTVKGCREGSLTEIHRAASCLLTGNDRASSDFIEIELDYEAGRITPNSLLIDYIRRHCQRGGQAILVSDMYMHAEQIAELLEKVGVEGALFAKIFSSADSKVSKASGGIFAVIEEALSASSDTFVHVGDSLHGDFQRPLAHGW
ncbi:MAG TPA: hypothetical protein PKD55_18120, partial [Bellilinea sp.]|nr:hypothetical protein [Bellilinea sp.]